MHVRGRLRFRWQRPGIVNKFDGSFFEVYEDDDWEDSEASAAGFSLFGLTVLLLIIISVVLFMASR